MEADVHDAGREKRAIRSLRLQHGRQQLMLTSPQQWLGYDAVGAGQGGMLLSPGEVVDVPVPPLADGQLLRYRYHCEDGLDVGFEVLSVEGGGEEEGAAAPQPLQAWRRSDELGGELRLPPGARIVVRFDNSFSWFQTRTVHFAIEAQPVAAARSPAERRACEEAEERSLRATYAEEVRKAEAKAARRVAALRDELRQEEARLASLTAARMAAEAAAAADAEAAAATAGDTAEPAGSAEDDQPAPGSVGGKAEAFEEEDGGRGEGEGGGEGGGEGEGDAAALSNLWRLWRRLALMDGEASVVASAVAPGEMLLREVTVPPSPSPRPPHQSLPGRPPLLAACAHLSPLLPPPLPHAPQVTLQGQRLSSFGLFGAHSDLDHVISLCLQKLVSSKEPSPVPATPAPTPSTTASIAATPSSFVQPTGGEPSERTPDAWLSKRGTASGRALPDVEPLEEAAPAALAEPAAERSEAAGTSSALDKLQWLSAQLLQLDAEATMDVAPLSEDEYQINAICVHGHALSSLGEVTACTDVAAILAVCTNLAAGCAVREQYDK